MELQFKRLDYLIRENLSEQEVKDEILPNLNELAARSNHTIGYCAFAFNTKNKVMYYLVDSHTKEQLNLPSEIVELDYFKEYIENKLENYYTKEQIDKKIPVTITGSIIN